ncbi:MAG: formate dehydrogenase accessory protein FdhE [Terriglobales bacterium]
MSQDPWQRRMERAEDLAGQHPFAAEILRFYLQVARFQGELYRRLESFAATRPQSRAGAASGPPELPELVAGFPRFLSVIEQHAPAQLAEFARTLRSAPEQSLAELLNDFWSGPGELAVSSFSEFPIRAFLQPYAEFVRLHSEIQWDGYTRALCPFCGRKPGLGVLRQQGDGGSRSLICSFCLAEWQFRRILCPGCGEEDHAKLPVFTAAELEHVRIECCDTCKSYLKTVDLTKNGLAEPMVDEIAAVPLDLWAQERGYSKLQPNLLQM